MSRTADRQRFDTFGFVVKRQLFPAPEIDARSLTEGSKNALQEVCPARGAFSSLG